MDKKISAMFKRIGLTEKYVLKSLTSAAKIEGIGVGEIISEDKLNNLIKNSDIKIRVT